MTILITVVGLAALLAAFSFGKSRGRKRAIWEMQPTPMVHIFDCTCGNTSTLQRSEVAFGSVMECAHCSQAWSNLYSPRSGTKSRPCRSDKCFRPVKTPTVVPSAHPSPLPFLGFFRIVSLQESGRKVRTWSRVQAMPSSIKTSSAQPGS